MTGEGLLRLYVFGLAGAFVSWALLVGWLVGRTAFRLLRNDRPLVATDSVTSTADRGDNGVWAGLVSADLD
jgi:hypothetical protein